jgi:hypothetical protein
MALDQQPNWQQILDPQFFYSGRDDACSSIFIVCFTQSYQEMHGVIVLLCRHLIGDDANKRFQLVFYP